MSKLKLEYFDINGGRGEPARLALHIGKIPFEDVRISPADWKIEKANMPFRALPVLTVGDTVITQSNTINRYVGKLAGLYPAADLDAAKCDEILDVVEDISQRFISTLTLSAKATSKEATQAFVTGDLLHCLKTLERYLQNTGGRYFGGEHLSMADLRVFIWVSKLRTGDLPLIPADFIDKQAPPLVEHQKNIANHPDIVAYYSI